MVNYYLEFLVALVNYISALNDASAKTNETVGFVPYVNYVPVLAEDELYGFLVDEVGGTYSYMVADADDRAWWAQRPWAKV